MKKSDYTETKETRRKDVQGNSTPTNNDEGIQQQLNSLFHFAAFSTTP